MNNRCLGCGSILQSIDDKKEGYVDSCKISDAKICKRCFKIKNYGCCIKVNKDTKDYKKILDNIKKENELILFLCDILSIDSSIEELNKFGGKVILVITKKDLLPKSVKEEKLLSYIESNYNLNLYKKIFVSSVKNYNLDLLLNIINKYKSGNEVYLVGNTNAGKSTLINAIIKSYLNKDSYITTSMLPNTTLDMIKIKINDDLTLIDTPGIVHKDNYLTNEKESIIKLLTPKVQIKPKTYQIKPNQSIIIGDYARIDYKGKEKNSITIYASNNILIKRINIDTNNYLRNLSKHLFSINKREDIVIKGLCFCKIVNSGNVDIYVKGGVKVYKRNSLI